MKFISLLPGFLFVSLISCTEKETEIVYKNLDSTQWFKYEVGDTLIFKNNVSAFDTYVLDWISTSYIAPGDDYTYEEFFQVSYEGIPQCNNCPISWFGRSFRGVSFSGDFHIVGYHDKDTISEYKLGDTTIYDIIVANDIPTEDTNYFKVKAFYYSHVYGYIRYDMYDDRMYELQLE